MLQFLKGKGYLAICWMLYKQEICDMLTYIDKENTIPTLRKVIK